MGVGCCHVLHTLCTVVCFWGAKTVRKGAGRELSSQTHAKSAWFLQACDLGGRWWLPPLHSEVCMQLGLYAVGMVSESRL